MELVDKLTHDYPDDAVMLPVKAGAVTPLQLSAPDTAARAISPTADKINTLGVAYVRLWFKYALDDAARLTFQIERSDDGEKSWTSVFGYTIQSATVKGALPEILRGGVPADCRPYWGCAMPAGAQKSGVSIRLNIMDVVGAWTYLAQVLS